MKRFIWRIRWLLWFFKGPILMGSPYLGTGEQRKRNRDILHQRWKAKEPKCPSR